MTREILLLAPPLSKGSMSKKMPAHPMAAKHACPHYFQDSDREKITGRTPL
jgi:hypothetical protein